LEKQKNKMIGKPYHLRGKYKGWSACGVILDDGDIFQSFELILP
jgi:hypothetical protein